MNDIEFLAYDFLCSQNEHAATVLQDFKNVVAGVNTIKFPDMTIKVDATRMSGEMNTSLGNGLVNLIIINFICEELYGADVAAVVEGDDSLYKTDAPVKTQDYVDCGFTCTLEEHESINTASFCGLIFDEYSEVVIANPIKYILKTPWINRRWLNSNFNTMLGLYKSRSLSLLWQFPGCPVINEYAKYLYRMTNHVRLTTSMAREFKWNNEIFAIVSEAVIDETKLFDKMPKKDITFGTRMIMEQTFGITIEHQLYLEDLFRNKNDLHPIYDEIILSYTTSVQQHFNRTHVIDEDISLADARDFNLDQILSDQTSQLFDLLSTTKTSPKILKLIKTELYS